MEKLYGFYSKEAAFQFYGVTSTWETVDGKKVEVNLTSKSPAGADLSSAYHPLIYLGELKRKISAAPFVPARF